MSPTSLEILAIAAHRDDVEQTCGGTLLTMAQRGQRTPQLLMHGQGQAHPRANPTGMPATDDEIREKYLERAIRELNTLARELQNCSLCPRGSPGGALSSAGRCTG